MKKSSSLLLVGLCAAGLLSGFVARRLSVGTATSITHDDMAAAKPVLSAGSHQEASSASGSLPEIPRDHSADTLETLASPDSGSLYGRLAQWLMDASEPDIAAYWASYQKGKRSNDITDLVFINWTRLNPQAAIAAVAGSQDEHYAWWAWASHDPERSLAAALAAGPDRVNNVAWGIGEFHPEWLRAHFKGIPEAAKGNAMSGMSKWDDGENPLETLKFLKENGRSYDEGTFKALAQKDPWAAFDWIKENPGVQLDRYRPGKDAMAILVASMSTEHPEDLRRLAEQTPSGELKRKMEAALFESLLATDPAAAIEQAKITASSAIAAERYSKIGLSLLKSDPDQAFEMGRNLLTAHAIGQSGSVQVEYPNGSSSWSGSSDDTADLLSSLISKDPARVMEMTIQSTKPGQGPDNSFYTVANQWANQDLVAYTNWVNQQTDPGRHDSAIGPIISQLAELSQFSEAAEWAMSSHGSRMGSLPNVFYQWRQADPIGAASWLDAANLQENESAQLLEILHPKNPASSADPFQE